MFSERTCGITKIIECFVECISEIILAFTYLWGNIFTVNLIFFMHFIGRFIERKLQSYHVSIHWFIPHIATATRSGSGWSRLVKMLSFHVNFWNLCFWRNVFISLSCQNWAENCWTSLGEIKFALPYDAIILALATYPKEKNQSLRDIRISGH